jgi:hypothetical protein
MDMKILEADIWVESQAEAEAAVNSPLSGEYPGLVCVHVSREQEPPIAQPKPDPHKDEKTGKMVQGPTPPPLPGKVRWRCHYKPGEQS